MSNPLQDIYVKQVIAPAAIVDNASFTTAEIDSVILGVKYDWCTIIFELGAMDIAMSALAVQQSDTTGTGFANITGFVGGTDFTLPVSTADNGICVFHVDLKGKKRFLDLVATGGDGAAGTFASAIAILSRGKEAPITASAKGLLVEVIG